MRTRNISTRRVAQRPGFTLIELLVVISIIAALMSLILPAIQQAREAGRRTQCQNNLKNISLAAMACAETYRGVLPPSGTYIQESQSPIFFEGHSWVVNLLPYLDQLAISDRWDATSPFYSGVNVSLNSINIPVLTCPNDNSASGKNGGLTYVANCGVGDPFVDVTHPIDPQEGQNFGEERLGWAGGLQLPNLANALLGRDTGVFWSSFQYRFNQKLPGGTDAYWQGGTPSAELGQIYDGAGNTIMFTENVNAGRDALTGASTWSDPSLRSCGFYFGVNAGTPATYGRMEGIDFTAPVATSLSENRFINQEKNGIDGGAPFPNSRHPGIVIAGFCDGSVRTVNEDMDHSVYVRLITPGAARPRSIAGFLAEKPLGGNEF